MVGRQGHWGMPAGTPLEETGVQQFAAGLRGELVRPEEDGYDKARAVFKEAWERRHTKRNWRVIEAAGEVAKRHGASHPQVALAWLKDRPTVSSVILGARTDEQLRDNLGATRVELTREESEALDCASAPDEPYPYRMIRRYGVRNKESAGGPSWRANSAYPVGPLRRFGSGRG